MNRFFIKKSSLNGTVAIPPSKSQTLRAILFASLADGTSIIRNPLASPDTSVMIETCRHLGAKIVCYSDHLVIEGTKGKIDCTEDVLQAGNSGIVLRFCTAIGALGSRPVVITGDYSIRHHRPMNDLMRGLSQLGVSIQSMRGDDFAPIILQGPQKAGRAILSGEDSQPVSALLISSAFVNGTTEIEVQNPGEKPWIDLTLDWLKRLGVVFEAKNYSRYIIHGKCAYQGFEYNVPGDLSTAAFPVVAALITGSTLSLSNVDLSDSQGDKEFFNVLKRMGAIIEYDAENQMMTVHPSPILKGVKVDVNDFIDALPILSVISCFANSETIITNADIAKQKECNRPEKLVQELSKMGANIQETPEGIVIRPSALKCATLLSHHDHRMALSLTIAGLAVDGETSVEAVQCISKTFPSFLQDFQRIGANIRGEA